MEPFEPLSNFDNLYSIYAGSGAYVVDKFSVTGFCELTQVKVA